MIYGARLWLIAGVGSLGVGAAAGLLVWSPSEQTTIAPVPEPEWSLPEAFTAERAHAAAAFLLDRQPWGIAEDGVDSEWAAAESDDVDPEEIERAEAERQAARWRFLGTTLASQTRYGLFQSVDGGIQRLSVGDRLADSLRLLGLQQDRAVLGFEGRDSPIRVRLFRDTVFHQELVDHRASTSDDESQLHPPND